MKENVIIAFGSVPKDGGTFTFYRTLRPKLLDYGIDLRCVTIGHAEASLWEESFADDGCVLLCPAEKNIKVQAKTFVEWCERNTIDIVMAINSVAMQSALPHLAEKIRVMSRLASISDNGLMKTMSCSERLVRIITTAPGHEHELSKYYTFDKGRLQMIPNGISTDAFNQAGKRKRGVDPVVQVGFLGRLEHKDKGAFFLPDIIRHLDAAGIRYRFKIAGKGILEQALKRDLKKHIKEGSVSFVGPLSPVDVPCFLGSVDVFVFPSQSEGCPNTLLEAMMAGCAIVSSRLEGITDFIIEDGVTGYLCPIGDSKLFSERVAQLDGDRRKMQQMAEATAKDARERFSQQRVTSDYASVINQVMKEPVLPWKCKPWLEFSVEQVFTPPSWRAVIPAPLKKVLKKCLFHLHLSNRYVE